MKFSKLLFFAAYARAEESGITAQDVADVIIANDNIQQFIETNELTFNIVEGCDEDCVDEEPTTIMDITMQITEGWDEDMASQVTNLFTELSEKYGDKFDEVLSLIDGFMGSSISEFWQQEENEEGEEECEEGEDCRRRRSNDGTVNANLQATYDGQDVDSIFNFAESIQQGAVLAQTDGAISNVNINVNNPADKTATVTCMNNDVVEMTVNIVRSAISHDLTEDGWTSDDVNDMYTKTWAANEFTDDEVTVDNENNLVLTKAVNTDCPKGEYGGAVVCLGVGLTLNFRCKYQLGETVVSSAVAVSGHDDDFDAEGTGSLKYTMTSTETVTIGKPITVTITPKTPDLVYAAIQSCRVIYNEMEMPLTTFADNVLESVCVFGTEIQTGSSMQSLSLSWNAFKWSSNTEDVFTENQKVECSIKLTKEKPNQGYQNCNGEVEYDCHRCNGCPNGDQFAPELGIDLLCQDNKPFVRVNKDTNFSYKSQANGVDYSYVLAGYTAFTAYRITFDDQDRIFMQTDDHTFSETDELTLGDGSIKNNVINAGTAGDCRYRPNDNPGTLSYTGRFSLDLTETGLAFEESVEWIPFGWKHGMSDYIRTDQQASAKCGGGCGDCSATSDFTPTPNYTGATGYTGLTTKIPLVLV